MMVALRDCKAGQPYRTCRGRSEHGGRRQVLDALRKRGLVHFGQGEWDTTFMGRLVLGEPWPTDRPAWWVIAAHMEPGPKFLTIPERWLESPRYRCENGHVSTMVLKSEALGRDACLECQGRLWITFPEDSESV